MPKPEDCRFARSHEWVHFEGRKARVGVSDHAQKEITDVVFVDLPKSGRVVKAGEACAVVESVKAAFDIYAPVSGTIGAVNGALSGDPALVNRSPMDEGWFFEIEGADPAEAAKLMSFAEYGDFAKSGAH